MNIVKLKKSFIVLLTALSATSSFGYNTCPLQGKVANVIASGGDAGLYIEGQSTCSCDGSTGTTTLVWIDSQSDGGKAMYSTALAARISDAPVTAIFIDDQGQTNTANHSIFLVAWPTCQVYALEM